VAGTALASGVRDRACPARSAQSASHRRGACAHRMAARSWRRRSTSSAATSRPPRAGAQSAAEGDMRTTTRPAHRLTVRRPRRCAELLPVTGRGRFEFPMSPGEQTVVLRATGSRATPYGAVR
jgi:hypothetical protein